MIKEKVTVGWWLSEGKGSHVAFLLILRSNGCLFSGYPCGGSSRHVTESLIDEPRWCADRPQFGHMLLYVSPLCGVVLSSVSGKHCWIQLVIPRMALMWRRCERDTVFVTVHSAALPRHSSYLFQVLSCVFPTMVVLVCWGWSRRP